MNEGRMSEDPRRLIVRLAVAVMAADGRINLEEMNAAERLDRLGLGPLSRLVDEEIERAVREPIDLGETCAGLSAASARAGAVILTALAEIATADRALTASEAQMLETIGRLLGLPPALASHVLSVARAACRQERPSEDEEELRVAGARETARRSLPETPGLGASVTGVDAVLARAHALLDVGPSATRAELNAAYRVLVERYDPAKVIELGPEFAALAVRKLAEITAAFEAVLASLEERA